MCVAECGGSPLDDGGLLVELCLCDLPPYIILHHLLLLLPGRCAYSLLLLWLLCVFQQLLQL